MDWFLYDIGLRHERVKKGNYNLLLWFYFKRISHKNALLILSNQVITLHEEHFKPIELWSYITEV